MVAVFVWPYIALVILGFFVFMVGSSFGVPELIGESGLSDAKINDSVSDIEDAGAHAKSELNKNTFGILSAGTYSINWGGAMFGLFSGGQAFNVLNLFGFNPIFSIMLQYILAVIFGGLFAIYLLTGRNIL